MRLERIAVDRINPAPYNPRVDLQPGDAEYDKLQRSLDTFGCVEPLVWNECTGHLVGGHQRLKVLIAQGYAEVDVSVVDLPLEQEKALNLALNRIQGDWDQQKLTDLLRDLGAIPDFDVSLTGFDRVEIGQLLDRFGPQADGGEDDFDLAAALEAANDAPAISQPGDLIELGRHRLLCGDSSKPECLDQLLAGATIDLLFTDPPYNVNYYGGNRPTPRKSRPKRSRAWKRIYMDDLTQEQYEAWLRQVLGSALPLLGPGAPFYIWNGHRQFGPMHAILTALGAHISCVITWAKPNFAIGYGDYNQQTEFCLYGWNSRAAAASQRSKRATSTSPELQHAQAREAMSQGIPHPQPEDYESPVPAIAESPPRTTANGHRWYGPTNESTLWEIPRDLTRDYRHPTQKPLALAERALRNSSHRGDVVLDLFLGSGSTLIAAERLDRACFGIEIDPRYCDAIVRRWMACVGPNSVPPELRKRFGEAPASASVPVEVMA